MRTCLCVVCGEEGVVGGLSVSQVIPLAVTKSTLLLSFLLPPYVHTSLPDSKTMLEFSKNQHLLMCDDSDNLAPNNMAICQAGC